MHVFGMLTEITFQQIEALIISHKHCFPYFIDLIMRVTTVGSFSLGCSHEADLGEENMEGR